MNNAFYSKIAFNNIKKNNKTYIPFILACIFTVAMMYIMLFITFNDATKGSATLTFVLKLGSVIIGLFSVLLVFYTNSFLIKRRTRELGLYNVLGLEKKHISLIILDETLFIAIISILSGIGLGIVFSKLMLLVLENIVSFSISYGFEISSKAMLWTVSVFIAAFCAISINNIIKIYKYNPIALLSSGNVGEKEPKTKLWITIIGIICLASGYSIAIIVESPINALLLFFVAVILVILGTYLLFISGSVTLLKKLKNNKKYYYQSKNFVSVSGMLYRMKQNAVGLANICILSTMVLVMLSTTLSLYIGLEDSINEQCLREIDVSFSQIEEEKFDEVTDAIDKNISESGLGKVNELKYESLYVTVFNDKNVFYYKETESNVASDICVINAIALDEFNNVNGTSYELADSEILIKSLGKRVRYSEFVFGDLAYSVKEKVECVNLKNSLGRSIQNNFIIVFKDKDTIINAFEQISYESGQVIENFDHFYGVDLIGEDETKTDFYNNVKSELSSLGYDTILSKTQFQYKQIVRSNMFNLNGGLLFLGIFLGIVFLMATVLILYYKQITEGYDDKKRFDILNKVGMSDAEIKTSIKSEVLTLFFLPLIAAFIHICFAFPMITRLLKVLALTNVSLFAICTIITTLVFAVFYIITYTLTAKTYFKIVRK